MSAMILLIVSFGEDELGGLAHVLRHGLGVAV